MAIALSQQMQRPSTAVAGLRGLPPRIRILFIALPHRPGGWLADAFAADSACEIFLEEAASVAAGLERLQEELFDAVLVSHEPDTLDALDFAEGYRAGGAEEPILVLGMQSEQELAAQCFEAGADGYVCVPTSTTRNLIWTIARAIHYRHLLRENHRLTVAERVRLQREHEEADRLLGQQRAIVSELEELRHGDRELLIPAVCSHLQEQFELPEPLVDHYRELLRTYVIMGSGNLSGELRRLAEVFATVGLTGRQTMYLHLKVLEEQVRGLGSRSTRHVMTRADLLVLELMVDLAETYRQRYYSRTSPPEQQLLPAFE
jgi:DNA-binding NarL/FixJ family response regulator